MSTAEITKPTNADEIEMINATIKDAQQQWVIFNGKIMRRDEAVELPANAQGAMAEQLNELKSQIETHAYFDLQDYIEHVKTPDVAAQMAQSVAFAVDVAINGSVRQLLKNLRERRVEHGIDSLSEMTNALEDSAFAEEVIRSAGKDELGPVATIIQLSVIREAWHNLAQELTGMTFDWQGVPRHYIIQPVEEMLLREVKLNMRPQTSSRIRIAVERRAAALGATDKADVDKMVQKRLDVEEARNRDRARSLEEQQGAIVTLYGLAADLGPELVGEGAPTADFYKLDVSLRRSMIEAAKRGASRAEDFATSSSSITDAEFDAISFSVLKVERELNAVLQGAAYTTARATEHV